MILVTVGMQLGFDRLIRAMDELAPTLDMPITVQTGAGRYKPQHMQMHRRIAPLKFEELVRQSSVIVSHAGIGSVLTARRFNKPIILMPRRADLGEHRNDHQLATVRQLEGRIGILVAIDETQLGAKIAEGLRLNTITAPQSDSAEQLQGAVARFIETGQL